MDAITLPAGPLLRRGRGTGRRRSAATAVGPFGIALLIADAALAAWLLAHMPAFGLPAFTLPASAAASELTEPAPRPLLPHFGRPFWRPPGYAR